MFCMPATIFVKEELKCENMLSKFKLLSQEPLDQYLTFVQGHEKSNDFTNLQFKCI